MTAKETAKDGSLRVTSRRKLCESPLALVPLSDHVPRVPSSSSVTAIRGSRVAPRVSANERGSARRAPGIATATKFSPPVSDPSRDRGRVGAGGRRRKTGARVSRPGAERRRLPLRRGCQTGRGWPGVQRQVFVPGHRHGSRRDGDTVLGSPRGRRERSGQIGRRGCAYGLGDQGVAAVVAPARGGGG